MFECLLCVASIYVTGAFGVQYENPDLGIVTNDYSQNIGVVEFVIELENGLFGKLTHLSGVDSAEIDAGLNSASVGMKIYLYKRR